MAPPPAHILPEVIAELERLAAFARRPEGFIDEPFGNGGSNGKLRRVVLLGLE